MEATRAVLLLLSVLSATAQDSCDFPINKSRLLNAWQSSHRDSDTDCFFNRDHFSERVDLNSKQGSYRFFHSGNKSQADGGFHWFAVQLDEPVLIKSMTVKGREDFAASVYERARNIQIWTSSRSSAAFSGDHCNSRSMSRQFSESLEHWTLCGVTQSRRPVIESGEIFTVNCFAKVRQLLLRRDIRTANVASYHDYMSFADLRLQTIRLETSKPQLVAEKSGFEVVCFLQCIDDDDLSANSTELLLCLPNGSCTADDKLYVGSAEPSDAGVYTCKFGSIENSTLVTVLSASHQVVAENSSFTVGCQLHCGPDSNCTGDAAPEKALELCLLSLSIGSCTPNSKLVAQAQPRDSGIYMCRAGSATKISTVAVLSSSPDQLVAQNSSFTVSCTLHYNGGNVLAKTSNKLRLCIPDGRCLSNRTIIISSAQPEHSGNYTCTLDSVEKRALVSVLYPPSSVWIALPSKVSCQNGSEVMVQFASSASQPVPEHRCSADADGVAVQNFTRLSQNSSEDGSVSWWKLVTDDEQSLQQWNGSLVVNCIAEQILPVGINVTASPTITQEFLCTEAQFLGGINNSVMKSVALSLISIFVAALILCIIIGLAFSLKYSRKNQLQKGAVEHHKTPKENDDGPMESELQVKPPADLEPDCSYLSVKPAGAESSAEHLDDDRSECTDFVSIVADGD